MFIVLCGQALCWPIYLGFLECSILPITSSIEYLNFRFRASLSYFNSCAFLNIFFFPLSWLFSCQFSAEATNDGTSIDATLTIRTSRWMGYNINGFQLSGSDGFLISLVRIVRSLVQRKAMHQLPQVSLKYACHVANNAAVEIFEPPLLLRSHHSLFLPVSPAFVKMVCSFTSLLSCSYR